MTREQQASHNLNTVANAVVQQTIEGQKYIAADIRALAKRHKVAYTETAIDAWARDITRLAGDDVSLDEIELLLIALQRAGHLSRPEALKLQVNYLREAKL